MLPSLLLSTVPSLLNASLSTTLPQPQPTQPSSIIYCFDPSPSDHRLIPITYIACRDSIKSIPLGDAGLKPVTFGRSSSAGFQVPYSWNKGSCAVEIDVTEEWVTETTSFASVLMMAFEIAVSCVIPAPHFGGQAPLGEEGGLKVWLYRFRPEAERERNLTEEW